MVGRVHPSSAASETAMDALLERPPIVKPLDSFPAFYATRRFITAFTTALHYSLS
jgi:hypothetical protein